MLKVEPIQTPGYMVNGLPITRKDALSLALFTVPPLVESKSVLFGSKLAHPISIESDKEKVWNVYESDRYKVWHIDNEHMAIQYGPYDNHVFTVSTKQLREMLWDMATAGIPELKRGEKFMCEITSGLYQINDHEFGKYGYYIQFTRSGVQVIGAKPEISERGIYFNGESVFSHYLFHSNVSVGTPSAFETFGFTTTTHVSDITDLAPIYTILDNPNNMLKVEA